METYFLASPVIYTERLNGFEDNGLLYILREVFCVTPSFKKKKLTWTKFLKLFQKVWVDVKDWLVHTFRTTISFYFISVTHRLQGPVTFTEKTNAEKAEQQKEESIRRLWN